MVSSKGCSDDRGNILADLGKLGTNLVIPSNEESALPAVSTLLRTADSSRLRRSNNKYS